MKRFFCSVCKKMKRTQKWPHSIENVTSNNPFERIGECNGHSISARHKSPELTKGREFTRRKVS